MQKHFRSSFIIYREKNFVGKLNRTNAINSNDSKTVE